MMKGSRKFIVLLLLLLIAGIAVWLRGPPPDRPNLSNQSNINPLVAQSVEPAKPAVTNDAQPAIMPLTDSVLEKFQEANSRAMQQLKAENPELPYPQAASLAVRKAIAELGYDPERSIQHWRSASLEDDLPARRTADNLLAVIQGDPIPSK